MEEARWTTMVDVGDEKDGLMPLALRRLATGQAMLWRRQRGGAERGVPSDSGSEEASRDPLLAVDELSVAFDSSRGLVRAVNGASFSVSTGETLGIVGESGCGKSVTALALLGLLAKNGHVTGGTALFEGRNLLELGERQLRAVRGRDIGMIFQDPMTCLNPVLTIGRQVRESLEAHREMSRAEASREAAELLGRVGIPSPKSRLDDYPHQFSGGMRQRAMIAMALACQPRLIIADEPTTALDVTIQAQILALLREIIAERRTALILITHDLGVVAGMCQRVNVMYAGRVVETGTADEIFSKPCHPYTLGLLQSVPRVDSSRNQRLQTIAGTPPDMIRAAGGCPFEPRCRYATSQCERQVPELQPMAPKHWAACFNPVQGRGHDETNAKA